MSFLRWILVLPASILGSLLAHLLGALYSWINSGGYSWYTGDSTIGIVEVCLFAMQNGLTGAAFVAAGWYVAPNHKNIVNIVLATLLTVFGVANLVLALLMGTAEWHTYLGIVASVVGAIAAAYKLNEFDLV